MEQQTGRSSASTTLINHAFGIALILLPGWLEARSNQPLYDLVEERLVIMKEVAAYKWLNDLPIEDVDREALVIERSTVDALRFGFIPVSSERFFRAQIEAAKDIQAHWFERWATSAAPRQAADLNDVLRPKLLQLGEAILKAAAIQRPDDSTDLFFASVSVEGLSEPQRGAVFRALLGLQKFPNRLDQILKTGAVRIGTTGDYAPFSFRPEAGEPSGVDVDLGRDLAGALGVRPIFVDTSWPTLTEDLASGVYDIAMSGVSRTLERQRHGYLSAPYYVGGKTPIVRCQTAAVFTTLEAIDKPDVRVIVNPGGTNERFVDANIRYAEIVRYPSNRGIFKELLNNRADVMITDRIEVVLQTRLNPELCATMADNLTYQEKAYLLPQDDVWLEFVNTWLDLRLADGTVAATFAAHGAQ